MIIIGIDPGYESLGYAALQTQTSTTAAYPLGLSLLEAGVIKTLPNMLFTKRLSIISEDLNTVLDNYLVKPVKHPIKKNVNIAKENPFNSRGSSPVIEAAVEKLFFQKNHRTAMHVAEARGVILHILTQNGVPICEYTPLQAKRAISGSGSASKLLVMQSLQRFFPGKVLKEDNAADAVALAVCHAFAISGTDLLKKKYI